MIDKFHKGQRTGIANNLNRVVGDVNRNSQITGDGFIKVNQTASGGAAVSLDIDKLLARIPKKVDAPIPDQVALFRINSVYGASGVYYCKRYHATSVDGLGYMSGSDYQHVLNLAELGVSDNYKALHIGDYLVAFKSNGYWIGFSPKYFWWYGG